MITTRAEDKPKVIALLIGVLAVFLFIGSTLFKFQKENAKETKRIRNANLMLDIPTVTESSGSMIMWRTAKSPIPDPFKSIGGGFVAPTPPPIYRPPVLSTNPTGPVEKPTPGSGRPLQPIIVVKGVILSDSGLGDMAVFQVGDVTRTVRIGQEIVTKVVLTGINQDGVTVRDLSKSVRLSVNSSYTPIP